MAKIVSDDVQFRAATGKAHGFVATPGEALNSLLSYFNPSDALSPIVIWPYNRGDSFFTDAQQKRLVELKAQFDLLSTEERQELEKLVEASFDATAARTQTLYRVKS